MQSLDAALFRFINHQLVNPFFDRLMPWLSWNSLFIPALSLATLVLIWKGGVRGRLCFIFLLLGIFFGDVVVCNGLKKLIGRPRPYITLEDTRMLIGLGGSGSMPSGHTMNWFVGATLGFAFYRKSAWFMFPFAAMVGLSRIYNGVHYPSDVLAGAALGVGFASALLWVGNRLWQTAGDRLFPIWRAQLPSIVVDRPTRLNPHAGSKEEDEEQWRRLGYLFIAAVFVARLIYLAAGKIELSEDEAYQWLWSKHLALSYYSKPPLIAYTQFLGTSIWGNNAFGVRFFSPVIAAIGSFLLFRFLAQASTWKNAFAIILALVATPLVAVGSILMTIDPLSVIFWFASMVTGWKAVQTDSTRSWLWTGLWLGLGFLSKYTALFQLLCWLVFFVLWKPARAQLSRPGPYLALGILIICSIPVLVWNYQHGWITMTHLASRAGLNQQWRFTLRFFWDFFFAEIGLLNPIFLFGSVWAAIHFWKRSEKPQLAAFLFSMGTPLFLIYFCYTLRARVQPNWIAPAVLPMFCLMGLYWEQRRREGLPRVKTAFLIGLSFGLPIVFFLHDTNLLGKALGKPLPVAYDPLGRVRGWTEAGKIVEQARAKLGEDGKPVFIITGHYGTAGLMSFYIPQAKAAVKRTPLVYYQSSNQPDNQFYFWPGYRQRKGENAIYVRQLDVPEKAPQSLLDEFESVKDLGLKEVQYRGRALHLLQLFECRGLR